RSHPAAGSETVSAIAADGAQAERAVVDQHVGSAAAVLPSRRGEFVDVADGEHPGRAPWLRPEVVDEVEGRRRNVAERGAVIVRDGAPPQGVHLREGRNIEVAGTRSPQGPDAA